MKNKNLLSLSGHIGSGKDTVASMIKFITYSKTTPRVKGFSLFDEWKSSDELTNWEIKKFAGKLKLVASILTGFPVEKFEDRDFKDSLLGEEWSVGKEICLNSVDPFKDVDFKVSMTVRDFLQKLGTEGLRNGLHENVWVNALFADYNKTSYSFDYDVCREIGLNQAGAIRTIVTKYNNDFDRYVKENDIPKNSFNIHGSKWIITDTRFENELEAVRERGGICIRLTKNSDSEASHSSETALDCITDWDFVIDNKDQSLEETFGEVERFVNEFELD